MSLSRREDQQLAFTIACLREEAIDLREFRQWLQLLSSDLADRYCAELSIDRYHSVRQDIGNIMSYSTRRSIKRHERHAILGIAYTRGISPFSPDLSAAAALKALRKSPKIYTEFQRTFPHIAL